MRQRKLFAYLTGASLIAGMVLAFPLPSEASVSFPTYVTSADTFGDEPEGNDPSDPLLGDDGDADGLLDNPVGDGIGKNQMGNSQGNGQDDDDDDGDADGGDYDDDNDDYNDDDDATVTEDDTNSTESGDSDQEQAAIEADDFEADALAGDIEGAAISIPAFVGTQRVAGEDRFQTAAAIVRSNPVLMAADKAFIAFGWNFPDALAAGAAAGSQKAPVLLAGRPGESETNHAIAVLNAMPNLKTIYIVGGPVGYTYPNAAKWQDPAQAGRQVWSYISSRLTAKSNGQKPVVDSTSLTSGSDRYATAALIAKKFFPNATELFLATGLNYADALTAAAVAGSRGAPVLLINPTHTYSLRTYLADYLKGLPDGRLLVHPVGGLEALPDQTFKPDFNYVRPGPKDWERIAGPTRYETATALAGRFFENSAVVYIARGFQFPDALAASPAAAVTKAPILLTSDFSLPASVRDYLYSHTAIKGCYVLGGENGIRADVYSVISAICTNRANYVRTTGVAVTPNFAAMTSLDATTQLTANVSPSNASYKKVVWSSDNWRVAEVDASGKVYARDYGSAKITARTVDGEFVGTAIINVNGISSITTTTGWKLAFSDNFEDQAVTDSQWVTRNPGKFADKSGRECSANLKENAVLSKTVPGEIASRGVMRLKATKLASAPSAACREVAQERGFEAANYGNAHIYTERFTMNYGIAAARVKMPREQGMHGTFWLYVPTTQEELDWESYGYGKGIEPGFLLNNATQTVLRDTNCPFTTSGCPWPTPPASKDPQWWDQYHIYSFEWSPNNIVFKVDGEVVVDPRTGLPWPGSVAVPKANFRIDLSLYTSDWELAQLKSPNTWHVWNGVDRPQPGYLPAEMAVDWVQAWTR